MDGERSHRQISFPTDLGGTGGGTLTEGALTGTTSNSHFGTTVSIGFLSHIRQSRMYYGMKTRHYLQLEKQSWENLPEFSNKTTINQ